MPKDKLLFALVGSHLVRADFDGVPLPLGIATTNPSAFCAAFGHQSWWVHSRYSHGLAEEPVHGRRVCLRMTVRRFLCPSSECPRRIFVEPLHGFAARNVRTTTRLTQLSLGRSPRS